MLSTSSLDTRTICGSSGKLHSLGWIRKGGDCAEGSALLGVVFDFILGFWIYKRGLKRSCVNGAWAFVCRGMVDEDLRFGRTASDGVLGEGR